MRFNDIPLRCHVQGRLTVAVGLFLAIFISWFHVSGQDTPCANPRSENTVFTTPSRTSLDRDCRRRIRRTPARTEGEQPDVSISGHITHQNGVRMSGVTMTLVNSDNQTTRTVITD